MAAKKRIIITGGKGRFAKVLKIHNKNLEIYYPDKKTLNILSVKSQNYKIKVYDYSTFDKLNFYKYPNCFIYFSKLISISLERGCLILNLFNIDHHSFLPLFHILLVMNLEEE